MKPIRILAAVLGTSLAAAFGVSQLSTAPAPTSSEAPTVVVYKSPTCGCCARWEDHLREHGLAVESRPTADMAVVKADLGVPADLASCHTAIVGGYVVEGHVPAEAVGRLLREQPVALGLAVPGMPAGSPGMEVPGQGDDYDVLLVAPDGSTRVY